MKSPETNRLCRVDRKEDLIHSLQKYVEVDEPEPEVPLIDAPRARRPGFRTIPKSNANERMTEGMKLLKGLEGLAPSVKRCCTAVEDDTE